METGLAFIREIKYLICDVFLLRLLVQLTHWANRMVFALALISDGYLVPLKRNLGRRYAVTKTM